jgi:alcohol dehydrogenase (cytochrome c)/quinohemoprotein ethanol dehydrogenase
MSGKGGAYNLAMPSYAAPQQRLPGRILAFRIDGNARLPARDKAPPAPFAPSAERFAPQQVASGASLFGSTCAVCHGSEGLSSGVLPDLRRSGAIADAGVFRQVVIDGVLADQGMVSFRQYLTPTDAEAIRAYINDRASSAKAKGEP